MIKVAQCWDDGLVNDIRLIEILRRYNAKAVFNLNPGLCRASVRSMTWVHQGYQSWHLAISEFKSVYEGFDIAAHGMRHVNPQQSPLSDFVFDIMDCKKWLEDFFQREIDGYAWPCGGYTPEAGAELKKAGFIYGRTTKNADQIFPVEDVMGLPTNCHYANPDFRKKFEAARQGCGYFYFWGHSCEMHEEKARWDDFESNIAWICEQPDVQWCSVSELVKDAAKNNKL